MQAIEVMWINFQPLFFIFYKMKYQKKKLQNGKKRFTKIFAQKICGLGS